MYREIIEQIGHMSDAEVERRRAAMMRGCPSAEWPRGMPGSLDPKVVVIGVSPGNSPGAGVAGGYLRSEPARADVESSHFYYPDSSNYWKKVRYLVHAFVAHGDEMISEQEAVLVASHFNLGTGSAGTATPQVVEPPYIRWVSRLLNSVLKPDTVVLFGLRGILRKTIPGAAWNDEGGLRVNWKRPNEVLAFETDTRNYGYERWRVRNALGHPINLVTWPNHPSRAPFSNMALWKSSVHRYLSDYSLGP